jgi:hypothetical protein
MFLDKKQIILDSFKGRWQDAYGLHLTLTDSHNGHVTIKSPLRQDNNPSFEITFTGKHTGRWIDWATKENGDYFTFYALVHNLHPKKDFRKVLDGIFRDHNIPLPIEQKIKHRGRPTKTPDQALHDFQSALRKSPIIEDLKSKRGITNEVIERFQLGFSKGNVTFPIRNAEGNLLGYKVHKGPHLTPNGNLAKKGEGIQATLYPHTSLDADSVVVAEGELDVCALASAGILAITNTAGAGTWKPDWSKLLKGKDVILAYDNDDAGQDARDRLIKELKGIAKRLRYVGWPSHLANGFDISDWIGSGKKWVDLPLKEVKIERVTLADVKTAYKKWLYFAEGEDIILDVTLGAVVANRFTGDPVWLFLVGPPGGSKTSTLQGFAEWREVYTLSSLTASTLVSGFVPNSGEDPSLLPQLNGKVLVVKDFTAILDMQRDARQQIMGDLRDAFDGSMAKAYGSGAGRRAYKSKFGLIAAVTPAIDRYSKIGQQLGERFLKLRLTSEDSAKDRIKQSFKNSGHEVQMGQELMSVIEAALVTCDIENENEIQVGEDVLDAIINLADVLAVLRSDVDRDGYTREIRYVPEPEIGTRLVKQLTKLARGIAAIRGKNSVGKDEFQIIRRIARDTLPSKRRVLIHTLYKLYHEGDLATQDIANEMEMPTETTKYALEDLRLLKIVTRYGTGRHAWRMTPEYNSRLEELDFFENRDFEG